MQSPKPLPFSGAVHPLTKLGTGSTSSLGGKRRPRGGCAQLCSPVQPVAAQRRGISHGRNAGAVVLEKQIALVLCSCL